MFGQSHNDGWEASTSSGSVGPHQLVNGYANGWLIRPDHAGTMTIDLQLDAAAPRVGRPRRLRRRGAALPRHPLRRLAPPSSRASTTTDADSTDAPSLDLSFTYAGTTPLVVTALLAGVAVGIGTAVVSRRVDRRDRRRRHRRWSRSCHAPASRSAIAIPVVLALSRILDEPELAWLTIALLVVDLAARWLRGTIPTRSRTPVTPEPAAVPDRGDELEAVGQVGVADQCEQAVRDEQSVMGGADGGEVGDLVGAVPAPGQEVMDLQPASPTTARHPTPRVAQQHRPAQLR